MEITRTSRPRSMPSRSSTERVCVGHRGSALRNSPKDCQQSNSIALAGDFDFEHGVWHTRNVEILAPFRLKIANAMGPFSRTRLGPNLQLAGPSLGFGFATAYAPIARYHTLSFP